MTSDTGPAFRHPEDRAAAMAGADPYDRISVRDYVVEVEIGAFLSEAERLTLAKELGQKLAELRN